MPMVIISYTFVDDSKVLQRMCHLLYYQLINMYFPLFCDKKGVFVFRLNL